MFNEEHLGRPASDEERTAAADAAPSRELGEHNGTGLPRSVVLGRFEDDDPPGAPR